MTLPDVHRLDAVIQTIALSASAGEQRPREAASGQPLIRRNDDALLVWGLGYVGTVSAVCLTDSGHEVVGIEPDQAKVETLQSGLSPIREPGLEALLSQAVAAGRLRGSTDPSGFVSWADASLVCVGTPSSAEGSAQLDALLSVAGEIGRQLAEGRSPRRDRAQHRLSRHRRRPRPRDVGVTLRPCRR